MKVVRESCYGEKNKAQLVGDQDGKVIVTQYDWSGFFSNGVRIQGIKERQQFSFSQSMQGKVISRLFCKEKTGRTDTVLHQRPTGHPKEIVPSGLDEARRKYLFKEIREFCTPGTRDLVCPEPPEETQPATKKARPK